jgi:hypothetical protein
MRAVTRAKLLASKKPILGGRLLENRAYIHRLGVAATMDVVDRLLIGYSVTNKTLERMLYL